MAVPGGNSCARTTMLTISTLVVGNCVHGAALGRANKHSRNKKAPAQLPDKRVLQQLTKIRFFFAIHLPKSSCAKPRNYLNIYPINVIKSTKKNSRNLFIKTFGFA
jgi:hypothetical protein